MLNEAIENFDSSSIQGVVNTAMKTSHLQQRSDLVSTLLLIGIDPSKRFPIDQRKVGDRVSAMFNAMYGLALSFGVMIRHHPGVIVKPQGSIKNISSMLTVRTHDANFINMIDIETKTDNLRLWDQIMNRRTF